MKWSFILVATTVLSSCFHASKHGVEMRSSGLEDHSSLKQLPGHIHPVEGKLSLTADFQHANEGFVTLYLINATKKLIAVPIQDGDPYCKREARTTDGEWRRCDSHYWSWCGNSYSSRELLSGGFVSWQQMLDSKHGKKRPMRFRLFNTLDVKSNEGIGKIADADLRFCRFDAMAMSGAPFEDVAAVATGEVKGSQGSSLGDNMAIPELERFAGDPRMYPVLKRAVARLVEQQKKHQGRYDFQACLKVLGKAKGVSVSSRECWDYVAGFVNDPHFPWSDEALDWLQRSYPENREPLRVMMGTVLSTPGHRAMREAMYNYAAVGGRQSALQKLDAIAEGKTYSSEERELAADVKETLLSKWKKE